MKLVDPITRALPSSSPVSFPGTLEAWCLCIYDAPGFPHPPRPELFPLLSAPVVCLRFRARRVLQVLVTERHLWLVCVCVIILFAHANSKGGAGDRPEHPSCQSREPCCVEKALPGFGGRGRGPGPAGFENILDLSALGDACGFWVHPPCLTPPEPPDTEQTLCAFQVIQVPSLTLICWFRF